METSRWKNNMAAAPYFVVRNVEELFLNNSSVFHQCAACLNLRDGDKAEFLSRRVEQYIETYVTSDVSTRNLNTS